MRTCIIAAMSENRVIGRDGTLPWHLPADLAHFKRLTKGRVVIMGRRTFDSIGGLLPQRTTVVISRRRVARLDGAPVVHGLDAGLRVAGEIAGDGDVFIAGGSEIYAQAIPIADRMHLTVIHATIDGDTHFPEFDPAGWRLVEDERHEADERHEHAFSFRLYER